VAKIIQLEPNVFVAPQLVEADFAEIAARGFRSVVNNRPDGESVGQMPHARAEAAARGLGLEFRYQPVTMLGVIDEVAVAEFGRLMDELPGPILFYCGSGTRCTLLWAQAAVRWLGIERTVEIAARAGYSLDIISEELDHIAGDGVIAKARQPEHAL
jgi:uncharacterized protein (TIGR01244 family)